MEAIILGKELLTLDYLNKKISYDPLTGLFKHKIGTQKSRPGSLLGYTTSQGYVILEIDRIKIRAHHLAWFLNFHYWPQSIDHKNGIPTDNRLENLRIATPSQQQCNTKPRPNRSGYRGVYSVGKRFKALLRYEHINYHLGTYDTAEEAFLVYDAASIELFGDYAFSMR